MRIPSLRTKAALLVSWVCLSCVPPLGAQEQKAEDPPRQVRGRTAHLVCTGVPENLENPAKVMTGKEIVEVTLSKRATSEAVKIPPDGILRMVREAPDPAGGAKPVFLTLAQAVIPESVTNALVILIPVPEKAGSDLVFRSEIHDLAGFGGGDYLYLNLTNVGIKVELGKDELALKPGQTRIFDAPVLSEPVNVPTRYSFFHPEHKKWRMLSASTIVMQPTRREICIFSWDSSLGRVEYHGLTFPVIP